MKKLGKYMFARPPLLSASGKTRAWRIVDRVGGKLGEVRWYGRWRCYAFFPDFETVFNASCMMELVEFCDDATKQQRSK